MTIPTLPCRCYCSLRCISPGLIRPRHLNVPVLVRADSVRCFPSDARARRIDFSTSPRRGNHLALSLVFSLIFTFFLCSRFCFLSLEIDSVTCRRYSRRLQSACGSLFSRQERHLRWRPIARPSMLLLRTTLGERSSASGDLCHPSHRLISVRSTVRPCVVGGAQPKTAGVENETQNAPRISSADAECADRLILLGSACDARRIAA